MSGHEKGPVWTPGLRFPSALTHSDDAGKLLSFSRISSAVFVQAKGFGVPVVIGDIALNGVFQFDHGFEDRQGYRIP